jgi:hypothetical protein
MATIMRQAATLDGWDVLILTAGQTHSLHFVAQPGEAELADAINAFEARLLNAATTETEETTNGLFDI